MTDTAMGKPKRKAIAEYEAVVARLLADMAPLEEQMDRDRAEGERLRAETQAIKAQTAATLSRLEEQIERLSVDGRLPAWYPSV